MKDESLQYIKELKEKHADKVGSIRRLNAIETELKQYKNLEEELGIDLITLFKALKDGVWIKYKKPWETKYKVEYFKPDEFAICFHDDMIMFCKVRYYGDEYDWGRSIEIEGDFEDTHYFGTSNYGKAWALTKEELK